MNSANLRPGPLLIIDGPPAPTLAENAGSRECCIVMQFACQAAASSSCSRLGFSRGLCVIYDPPPPFQNPSAHTHGSQIRGSGQSLGLGNALSPPSVEDSHVQEGHTEGLGRRPGERPAPHVSIHRPRLRNQILLDVQGLFWLNVPSSCSLPPCSIPSSQEEFQVQHLLSSTSSWALQSHRLSPPTSC